MLTPYNAVILATLKEPDDVRGYQHQQEGDTEPDEDHWREKETQQSCEGLACGVSPSPRTRICRPPFSIGCEKSKFLSRSDVIEIAAMPRSALLLDKIEQARDVTRFDVLRFNPQFVC